MALIGIPFPFGDLPIKPELTGKIKITDEMQQTLATLIGWDGSSRRLVRTSNSGNLQIASSRFGGIITKAAGGAGEVQTFDNIETTEIMIMAHPSNAETIWVNVGTTPTNANSWPLNAEDVLQLSIDNLQHLKIMIEAIGERVIVLYTK